MTMIGAYEVSVTAGEILETHLKINNILSLSYTSYNQTYQFSSSTLKLIIQLNEAQIDNVPSQVANGAFGFKSPQTPKVLLQSPNSGSKRWRKAVIALSCLAASTPMKWNYSVQSLMILEQYDWYKSLEIRLLLAQVALPSLLHSFG